LQKRPEWHSGATRCIGARGTARAAGPRTLRDMKRRRVSTCRRDLPNRSWRTQRNIFPDLMPVKEQNTARINGCGAFVPEVCSHGHFRILRLSDTCVEHHRRAFAWWVFGARKAPHTSLANFEFRMHGCGRRITQLAITMRAAQTFPKHFTKKRCGKRASCTS
jgi:hypothetical protein